MSQPLFQLRKELTYSVSEDFTKIEDFSSIDGNIESSGATETNSNYKYSNEVLLTESSNYVVTKLAPSLCVLSGDREDINGCVDTYSGNALYNDTDNLYVWRYDSSQRNATFMRIPLHEEHESVCLAPKCCFTWPSTGDDIDHKKCAGILIINRVSGVAKLYEDISTINNVSALISKKHEISLDLKFNDKEYVVDVVNAEPSGILVSTTFGRLLLITIRDRSGKPCLQLKQQLIKSQLGVFSHKMDVFKEVVSIRPGPIIGKGERLLYSITRKGKFKIWNVSATMSCYSRVEVDVYEQILELLQDLYPFAHETLQVLDLHPLLQDLSAHLILASISDGNLTYYICTTIKVDERTNSFSIFSVYRLNTYTFPNEKKPQLFVPGALDSSVEPRISHTLAYFLFEDAIVCIQVSNNLDSNYQMKYRWEDIIRFRTGTRIVGHGYDAKALYLINGNNSVIKIEPKFEKSKTQAPRFIKSHINQAVYFSQVDDNPINFNLLESIELERAELEKDISATATEILLSQSNYIPPKLKSLTSHLKLREDLFVYLMQYVKSNFINKIAPHVKLSIIEQYEIIKCSLALLTTLEDYPVFAELWNNTLISEKVEEEQLFLFKLNEFPEVFGKFLVALNDALRTSSDRNLKVSAAKFINGTVYQACLEEGENEYRYGQLDMAITEVNNELLWLAKHSIPQSINDVLFHLAFSTDDMSVLVGNADQILNLIKILYYLSKQTDVWFRNKNVDISTSEYKKALDFYTSSHLPWIQLLCRVNRTTDAVQIADFYHDLEALVESLSNFDRIQADAIYQKFLSKYEYEFAKTLFTYLIEHKKINDLFFQFQNSHDYLESFFNENPQYGYVSWIGKIFDEQYLDASKVLTSVATSHTQPHLDVLQTQSQLSIAKLSALAAEENIEICDLEYIQFNLDLIEFQTTLKSLLRDHQILHRYLQTPTVSNYYNQLKKNILDDRPASFFELIDIATVIDEKSVFHESLKFSTLNKTIQPKQKRLLVSLIWTRCILSDSWPQPNDSTHTNLNHTISCFFHDQLFANGIQLPNIDALLRDIHDTNHLSSAFSLHKKQTDVLSKSLKNDSKLLQNLPSSSRNHIHSLVASANLESGAKCVINYENFTIE